MSSFATTMIYYLSLSLSPPVHVHACMYLHVGTLGMPLSCNEAGIVQPAMCVSAHVWTLGMPLSCNEARIVQPAMSRRVLATC